MNTITFKTDRNYEKQQVIQAYYVKNDFTFNDYLSAGHDEDFFDMKTPECIYFNDSVRGITGKIKFGKLTEKDIMRAYDNGQYIDVTDFEFNKFKPTNPV